MTILVLPPLLFWIWALARVPVAACGLSPVPHPGGPFPEAGIVRATSGHPTADHITVTLLGPPEAIECAELAVAQVTAAAQP